MASCCKQTEGGEGELKGSVDLRFAHAAGGSWAVLPFAGESLRVGGAVVVCERRYVRHAGDLRMTGLVGCMGGRVWAEFRTRVG